MTNKTDISRRRFLQFGAASAAAGTVLTAPGASAEAAGKTEKLPQVPRKRLGKTGKDIPILLMGGAFKLDRRFDPRLAEAVRFGVNYFDAAYVYAGGTTETAVGNYHTRAKNRDKIWITSKSDKFDPDGFEARLKESLQKLRTDHVDMYFLHGIDDPSVLTPQLAKRVDKLKKQGKLKHFGFSCHDERVAELLTKAATLPWVETVMFRYNFRQYGNKALNTAMDKAHKSNIGLIAMKTQGSEAGIADAWKKFEKTGKWSKHQAVMKAVWADERITAAVSHMDTFEKLKANIAAATDQSKLSQLEWKALHKYAADTRHLACDGCESHCSAAAGHGDVRMADTMRLLMYHDHYGETEKAKALFLDLPKAARNLCNLDFTAANAACPHGVDVVAHIGRAAKVFNA